VEFALVIPVFLFMLYGLITYGVILAQKQQITNAAADAARSGVGAVAGTAGGGPAGETQSAAVQRVAIARVVASLGAQGNYTATTSTGTCSVGSGTCLTVNIVYDYANHPLVPNAPGIGLFTPSTFHSTAIVQYS